MTTTDGHDPRRPRVGPAVVVPWVSVRSDRYEEAFWWVASIPAAVIAGTVAAVIRPSNAGVLALGLLALAGGAVEVLVVRTFQRRCAGDPDAHPASGVPDAFRRPGQLTLVCGLLIALMAWKAEDLGQSLTAGLLTGAGFVALVGVIARHHEGARDSPIVIGRPAVIPTPGGVES